MKQLKKTLLTLVALLAVTTGAWADVLNIVFDGTSATIKYDGNASNNPYFVEDEWLYGGGSWDEECTTRSTITTVTIDGSCKNFSGTNLHGLFAFFSGLTTINGLENLNTANVQDMGYMFIGCSSLTSLDLSSWNTASVEFLASMFNECSELTTVDLSSWNTAKVWNTICMFNACSMLENIYVGDGWSTAAVDVDRDDDMFKGCTKLLSMNTANPATNKTNAHTGDGGYLKVKPAPSSGPEVAWTAASKTGTFTMPGGNVTLEPEYYPQATVAEGAVTAADADARATTDDPLVKVDATKLTGAKKLMYFVSNSGTTPAYDAEGWTDQLPTAEGFTQQGIVYVWYYPVGTDEGVDDATATYSDGDICLQSITARIAAAPTYAVTFAEGTEESDKWKAEPNADVKKGTEVTVTYTGSKKVIGVKAEKKAAAPATPLDNTMTAWTAGKYAVPAGGLTYSAAITVSGDVTLVLTDGETLTLNKGISLASGATLTVEGNGTMNVNGTNESTASTVAGTGMLVLTSGTLNAKGGNGQSMIINSDGGASDFNTGASGGVAINGNVTVNGGTVTATGGNGGNLTITGEDDVMDDHGGNGGAAISGSVTVNTGTWTATNGSNGILTLNPETEPEDGNSAGIGGKAVAGNVTDNR